MKQITVLLTAFLLSGSLLAEPATDIKLLMYHERYNSAETALHSLLPQK